MASVLRISARAAFRSRSFATSSVARKDLVQDMYLKELKAYVPTPVAKDAHVGVVKILGTPAAPKIPAFTSDLAAELASYDAASPVGDVSTVKTTGGAETAAGPSAAEAFLELLEQDLPKKEHHHH